MKKLTIPYIKKLENNSLEDVELLMAEHGAHAVLDQCPWADRFPEFPDVKLHLAASETHLVALYDVSGNDLVARYGNDHGNVWEDSCVELFVEAHDGSFYTNVEVNCIGTALASSRRGRECDVRMFSAEEMARIIRKGSLPHQTFEQQSGIHHWKMAVAVPFDLLGFKKRPEEIRANFYNCADATDHPHFIAWSPIDAPNPDFHRPDFFGTLKLQHND